MKWQDTWEPEDRLMEICTQQISEFWKDYYQRTQNNFQQQVCNETSTSHEQQQQLAPITKQLHHVQQQENTGSNPTSSFGNLASSFPDAEQQQQQPQNAMMIQDVVQSQTNSITSTSLIKPTTNSTHTEQIQEVQLSTLEVATRNNPNNKQDLNKGNERLQENFQSIPPHQVISGTILIGGFF